MPSTQTNQSFTAEGLSGFVIEQTAKRLKRAFQQALLQMDAGITADQWVMIDLLATKGSMNQLAICEYLAKDAATVTRMIDLLEKKAILERTLDQNDRRRFVIDLTKSGKSKRQSLIKQVRKFRQRHFNHLSSNDIDDLLRILNKINLNIQS